MSGMRPHNPWIDAAVILGLIGALFLASGAIWWMASFIARHPQAWVSIAMGVSLLVGIWVLERDLP